MGGFGWGFRTVFGQRLFFLSPCVRKAISTEDGHRQSLRYFGRYIKVHAAVTPEAQPERKWFSDSLIIATVPPLVYLLTLAHVIGYASYFEIPIPFISVTWAFALIVCIILIVVFVLAYVFVFLLTLLLPRPKQISEYVLALVYVPPALILVLMLLHRPDVHWNRPFFIGGMVFSAILDVCLYVQARREKERVKRFLNQLYYGDEPVGPRFHRTLLVGTLLLWVIAGSATSAFFGRLEARYSKEYYILQGTEETVVLLLTQDMILSAPFDRTTRTVKRTLILTKTSDRASIVFRMETVGPLHLEPRRAP